MERMTVRRRIVRHRISSMDTTFIVGKGLRGAIIPTKSTATSSPIAHKEVPAVVAWRAIISTKSTATRSPIAHKEVPAVIAWSAIISTKSTATRSPIAHKEVPAVIA
jgi:hypothetical protein